MTENLHQHLITQNIIKYKIEYLQSKKHHFEESGWEEEFNSLFPYKQTESDNTLVKKNKNETFIKTHLDVTVSHYTLTYTF